MTNTKVGWIWQKYFSHLLLSNQPESAYSIDPQGDIVFVILAPSEHKCSKY